MTKNKISQKQKPHQISQGNPISTQCFAPPEVPFKLPIYRIGFFFWGKRVDRNKGLVFIISFFYGKGWYIGGREFLNGDLGGI